jgi:hypothetical protein
MRRSGTEQGRMDDMKDVISDRTRVVGPVSPFSLGLCTERPHPL